MRRIVHYYPGAMGNSGVTFALWSWARAQAASGAEVRILHAPETAPGSDVAFVAKEAGTGLTTAPVPHRGRHRLTRRPVGLHRMLGKQDLLVLHEGWVPSNLVAAAAARRAGVPYVVMPHGVYDHSWMGYLRGPLGLRRALERRLLEGAAAVHVFFPSESDDVKLVAPSAQFITVPTGFEVPGERWTGGGGYLGWIGRVDPVHKGLDALVGAIAQMPRDARPTLRICGYDYKGGIERLRRLIAERGLDQWVRIEGAVAGADKTRFMQRADGYVHPSRWECHSISLLEHLALGVPCVVSNAIHIAPTLERSTAAVLTEPSEAPLAAALPQLAARGATLGGRGRALIRDAFNWTQLMPQFHAALARAGVQ
jgi:glycosyltransferase involved in cell wall biosynthesis